MFRGDATIEAGVHPAVGEHERLNAKKTDPFAGATSKHDPDETIVAWLRKSSCRLWVLLETAAGKPRRVEPQTKRA